MAVRFDNMQMLFGKINNGSPFGVIRGFYDYFPNNPNNSPQLRQFLNNKCHFIGFVVELSNPNTFIQSLFLLGSFLHGKTIESFDNPKNYPPITLPPLQTTVEIEEHRKNTTFDQNYNSLYYRQSSAQNIKINEIAINEIANDLESGKIVGKKIISDALLSVC
ncbi:hypothetical protein DUHN22_13460 [Helicobacter pylori]